jgi:hypothetical protein
MLTGEMRPKSGNPASNWPEKSETAQEQPAGNG